MDTPAETGPFQRLRMTLTRDSLGDPTREAARQVMSPEFERIALSPGWPPQARLSAIAGLAQLAQDSNLPQRERVVVIHELNRLALRVLWWEGLLGPGMVQEAPPDVAAAALIEIVAAGLIPDGPAGMMLLDRAKALLRRQDVVHALRNNTPRRDRLLTQLVTAEARLKPLQV
jgi:hypothetical protein